MDAPSSPSLGPASDDGPSNRALMGLAFVAEQDASASLLRGGVRLLREQRFAVTDLEAVLALLAPGLERLSKLVLGTVQYEKAGHWPTVHLLASASRDGLRARRLGPHHRRDVQALESSSA